MNRVLVVGGGGREHALAWACARDRDDVELICAPGNGGTAAIAENVALSATDAGGIARLAREREVDLVIVGPDAAVAAGVADACIAAGVPVFGPTAAAARIESSKSFAKSLMDVAGIPTPRWMAGAADDRAELDAFIADLNGACAVKADGLALGKGVVVCDSVEAARAALDACFDARFGAAGERVVIEELLYGSEVTVLGISDGLTVRVLMPARDHKRAFDGDRGPNTGGMGAVAPPPDVDRRTFAHHIGQTVLQPCIDALRARGTPFVGCLYAGLMLTGAGVRVLEFNARFGDPEAQTVLPLLDEPAVTLFEAATRGSLEPGVAAARGEFAVGVVGAAGGYPGDVRTGDVIEGLDRLDDSVVCFHAGTRRDPNGTLRTSGGRVLCVVAVAAQLEDARRRAYANIARVHVDGMRFRSDIAAHRVSRRPAGLGVMV